MNLHPPSERSAHAPAAARFRRIAWVVALAVSGGAGAGCSKTDPANTQVAAKVDGGEISVHQVQEALSRQSGADVDGPRVLEMLVEQELAARAARDEGIDKDPSVVQALELARRELLARSFQDRIAAKASPVTSDEIDRFYSANAPLFADRRLYTLQELVVSSAANALPTIEALTRLATDADQVAASLRDAGIQFRSRLIVRASEDLGEQDPFAVLKDGQSVVTAQNTGAIVYTVVRAQSAPLDRAGATDLIGGYLTNQRQREAVVAKMKSLREKARIEYVGAFASAPAAGTGTGNGPAGASAGSAASSAK